LVGDGGIVIVRHLIFDISVAMHLASASGLFRQLDKNGNLEKT